MSASRIYLQDETAQDWGKTPTEFNQLPIEERARMVALSTAKSWRELVVNNGDKLAKGMVERENATAKH